MRIFAIAALVAAGASVAATADGPTAAPKPGSKGAGHGRTFSLRMRNARKITGPATGWAGRRTRLIMPSCRTGSTAPSSVATRLHRDAVEDPTELALRKDPARDEFVGIVVRAPLDDPSRHARRDARQRLDLAE